MQKAKVDSMSPSFIKVNNWDLDQCTFVNNQDISILDYSDSFHSHCTPGQSKCGLVLNGWGDATGKGFDLPWKNLWKTTLQQSSND